MRRYIAAIAAIVLTASGLTLVNASTATARARTLGPRVIHIDGGTFTTVEAGAPNQAFSMSEFRVRGNSSAAWPKKPYGVVFTSSQSPFGLPSGTSFRLQANYHDRSLLRNKVSYDLASRLSGLRWTPQSVFAELVLNGRYMGSYQLIQEIKIETNRVNIPSSTGLIAEFGVGRVDADGMRSEPKDPESGARMSTMIDQHVNPFIGRLRTDGNWQDSIDMDSFVDYYLIKEFTKDKDADFFFSNYYYTADVNDPTAKMFMGPVWDFDRSAGNEAGITRTTVAKPQGWWVRYHNKTAIDRITHLPEAKNNWYNRLVDKPAFRAALCARWQATAGEFNNVAYGGVSSAVGALGGPLVANNDRAVWGRSRVERPPSRGKWTKEVKYLRKWYKKRFRWMNANICR